MDAAGRPARALPTTMEPRIDGTARPAQVGPYRLGESIGAGGMGTVWRAWDERLRRQVAVKHIRADAQHSKLRERLWREAQTVARLNHPSIVQVYDLVESSEGDWIVMELVEGKTVRALIKESGRLSVEQTVQLALDVAEGLAEAHSQGILHRDLKASNIMVTSAGRAKILDFGLAKQLPHGEGGEDQDASITASGLVVGTCYAMSPEQVLGRPLDARSDLFSLGSLIYEMVTGEPPFRAATSVASMASILSSQPPPLVEDCPEMSQELSGLVGRLLQKDPGFRPQSAREVVRTLTGHAGVSTPQDDSMPATVAEPVPVPLVRGQDGGRPDLSSGSAKRKSQRWAIGLLTVLLTLGVWLGPRFQAVFRLPIAVLPFESLPGVTPADADSADLLSGLLAKNLAHEMHYRLVPMDITKLLADTLPLYRDECLDQPSLREIRRATGAIFVIHGLFRKGNDGQPQLSVCLQRTDDVKPLDRRLWPARPGNEARADLGKELGTWLAKSAKPRFFADVFAPSSASRVADEQAVRFYLEGLWHLKRYALRDAQKKLNLALKVDPSFFEATLALSRTSRELGHYANATKETDVALRLLPQVGAELGPKAEIQLKAYRDTALFQWDTAISAHRALSEMFPLDPDLACQLVEVQNMGGRGKDAHATVREIRNRVRTGALLLPHPFDAQLDIEEATAHLIVGRTDCQWAAARRAGDKLMGTPDVLLEARAKFLECDALVKKNQDDFSLCEEAANRFQRRNDLIGYGRMLQVKAQWLANREEYAASVESERSALRIFKEGRFYLGWVDQLSNLSYTESLLGHDLEARKLCAEAIALAGETNSPKLPRIILNCAYFLVDEEKYEKALAQYEQSVDVARRNGDMMMEAVALGNVAYMHHKLGITRHDQEGLERARVHYEDSVALSRKLKETGWELGETLLRHARLLCDLHREDAAQGVFLAGLRLYHGPQRSELVAESLASFDDILGPNESACWKRLTELPLPAEESTQPASCEPEETVDAF